MASSRTRTSNTWEFDATGFARALATRRAELGLSTRDVSRRAAISQAYVVALERARIDDGQRTPTPTVDVLARLADALETPPNHLLRLAIRRTGQHVLLLVDGHGRTSPLAAARRIADDDLEWVWAASSVDHGHERLTHHHIDLRRTHPSAYEPAAIARSLHRELAALGDEIEGRQLGLVFAETSDVMGSIDDPEVVLRFEHAWDEVVSSAARSAGAHAAWNICVYEMPAIQRLARPVDAMADLMRSHDTVWYARRSTMLTDAPAARSAFDRLRPDGVRRSDWDATTTEILTDLGYAA